MSDRRPRRGGGFLADTTPLRTPAFRRLWLAGVVTVVGAQLTVVAVPAQLYALTGSSAYVGLSGVFGLVPLIVFGSWGGAIADVVDRQTMLQVLAADEMRGRMQGVYVVVVAGGPLRCDRHSIMEAPPQ